MRAQLGSLLGLVIAGLCLLPCSVRAADESSPASEATITFRGTTAAAGVGFAWGASSVEYQGETYPVRADGFVLGAVGVATIEGEGRVTGLRKIEDLNGDYTALVTGGTLGRGKGEVVLRNDKGVRITMAADMSGLQLGFGPRGVTLEVGPAGGRPASARARLPETLAFGEMSLGRLYLKPTVNAQLFLAGAINPAFEGAFGAGPLDEADDWVEHSNELGINGRLPLGPEGEYGELQARLSGVFSLTRSGPDGPACNGSDRSTSEYTNESAYLAWRSGDLFPALGHDGVELSFGNQNYQVFDGLLFWDGGQDCNDRGANWISPRKAFHEAGIATVHAGGFLVEGAHLKLAEEESTDTRMALGRLEYEAAGWLLSHLKLGLMYFRVYESETEARDGLDGIYVYHEATPLAAVPGFTWRASFVQEQNSSRKGLDRAYGWYVSPAYQFQSYAWKPELGYRYALFTGGGDDAFDPLFGGIEKWGSWVQGELLGEFVISNSNLRSHQVRLTLEPNDDVTLNLIYYNTRLDDDTQSFGLEPSQVGNRALANEFDVIVDYTLTNWASVTFNLSFADPDDAFEEAVGASETWVSGYLALNFNF
jgi:hypothetical protein